MPKESFAEYYSEASFRDKLKRFGARAGREVVYHALVLFYCLRDADTPARVKTVILGSLGYFILPTDLVPDLLPGGFTDDLGALALALAIAQAHVKEEHRRRARQRMARLGLAGKEPSGTDG